MHLLILVNNSCTFYATSINCLSMYNSVHNLRGSHCHPPDVKWTIAPVRVAAGSAASRKSATRPLEAVAILSACEIVKREFLERFESI